MFWIFSSFFNMESYSCLLLLLILRLHVKSLHSCLTLCDPMGCSLPGSSVRGIFQARILEWVAISSSRESSQPRGLNLHLLHFLHWQVILYHCASWEALPYTGFYYNPLCVIL